MFYIKQTIALASFLIFLLIFSRWAVMTQEARTRASDRLDFPFLGINYPWHHYGHDFGVVPNEEHDGVSNEESQTVIEADFADMQQHGVLVVRWFILPDGRASPDFDAEGQVTGLDDYFYDDFDAALAIAEAHDIKLIVVLFDFYWFDSSKNTQSVTNLDKRQLLFDHALEPLLERYGSDERILAWDIMNEPEWAMTIPEGNGIEHPISAPMMQEFVSQVAALIHDKATQPVTLGGASFATLEYWREIELDFYQVHYYDNPERLSDVPSYSDLALNQPVMVGEFATLGSKYAMTEQLDTFWSKGYQSALAWSYRASDDATDFESQAPAYCQWAKSHIPSQETLNCPPLICPLNLNSPQGSVPIGLKACSADGTRYARELEPAHQGQIGIFDQSNHDLLMIIEANEQDNNLKGLAWSPDSSQLAYIYHHQSGSAITLVDSNSTQSVRSMKPEKWYHYIEYSADGKTLLLAVDIEQPDVLDTRWESILSEKLYLPLIVKE